MLEKSQSKQQSIIQESDNKSKQNIAVSNKNLDKTNVKNSLHFSEIQNSKTGNQLQSSNIQKQYKDASKVNINSQIGTSKITTNQINNPSQKTPVKSQIADNKESFSIKSKNNDPQSQLDQLKIAHNNLRENYDHLKIKYYEIRKNKEIYDSIISTSKQMREVFLIYEKMDFLDVKALKTIDFSRFDKNITGIQLSKIDKNEQQEMENSVFRKYKDDIAHEIIAKQSDNQSISILNGNKSQSNVHQIMNLSQQNIQKSNINDFIIEKSPLNQNLSQQIIQKSNNNGFIIEQLQLDQNASLVDFNDIKKLQKAYQEITSKLEKRNSTINVLQNTLKEKLQQINEIEIKAEELIQNEKEFAKKQIFDITENFNNEITKLNDKYRKKIIEIEDKNSLKESKKDSEFQQTIEELLQTRRKMENVFQQMQKVELSKKEIKDENEILKAKIQKYAEKNDKLMNEQKMNTSRLMASEIKKSALQNSLLQSLKPDLFDQKANEIRIQREEYQKLKQEIANYADLSAKYDQLKFINLDQNDRISDSENEKAELEKQKENLLYELSKLNVIFDLRGNEKKNFETKIESQIQEISKLNQNVESINLKVHQLQMDIKERDETIIHIQDKIPAYEIEKKALSFEINEKLMDIQKLIDEKAKIQERLQFSDARVLDLKSALKIEKEEVISVRKNLENVEEFYKNKFKNEFEQILKNIEDEKSKMQNDLAQKDLQSTKLVSEVENLYKEVDKLQEMMLSKKEKIQHQIKTSYQPIDLTEEKVYDQINVLNYLLTTKEKEIEDLSDKISQNKKDLDFFNDYKLKADNEILNLISELKKMTFELQETQKFKAAFEDMEKSVYGNREIHLKHEIATEKMQEFEAKYIKTNFELDLAKSELNQKAIVISKQEEEISKLSNLLSLNTNKSSKLEQEMSNLNIKLTDLTTIIDKNNGIEKENANLKQDLALLMKKLPETESMLNADQIQIKLLKNDVEKHEKNEKAMKLKLSNFQNELAIRFESFYTATNEKDEKISTLESKINDMKKWFLEFGDVQKMLTDREAQIFQMAKLSNQRKDEMKVLESKIASLTRENEILLSKLQDIEAKNVLKKETSSTIDKITDTSLKQFRLKYKIPEAQYNSTREYILLYELLDESNLRLADLSNFSESQKKFGELVIKVNVLEGDRRIHNNEVLKLKDLIDNLEYNLSNSSRKCKNLEEEKEDLASKLEEKKKEVGNYFSTQKNLQFIASQKEEQINTLKETISDLNKMIVLKDEAYKNIQELYSQNFFDNSSSENNVKILHFKLEAEKTEKEQKEAEINRLRNALIYKETIFLKKEEEMLFEINSLKTFKDQIEQSMNNKLEQMVEVTEDNIQKENDLNNLKELLNESEKEKLVLQEKCYSFMRIARYEIETLPALAEFAQLKDENEKIKIENEEYKKINAQKVRDLQNQKDNHIIQMKELKIEIEVLIESSKKGDQENKLTINLIEEQNKNLKAKIDNLLIEIENKEEEIGLLNANFFKKEKEKMEINQKSIEKEKNMNKIMEELKNKNAQNLEYESKLEQNINNLQKQCSDLINDKNKLNEEIENLKNNVFQLQKERSVFQEERLYSNLAGDALQIEQINAHIQILNEQKNIDNKLINENEQKFKQEIEELNNNIQKQRDLFSNENKLLKKQCSDLTNDKNKLNEEIEELKNNVFQLQKEQSTVREERLYSNLAGNTLKLEQLNAHIQISDEQKNIDNKLINENEQKFKQEIEELNQKISCLEDELVLQKGKFKENIEVRSNNIKSLANEKEEMNEINNNLVEENEKLLLEIEKLKEKMSQLENELIFQKDKINSNFVYDELKIRQLDIEVDFIKNQNNSEKRAFIENKEKLTREIEKMQKAIEFLEKQHILEEKQMYSNIMGDVLAIRKLDVEIELLNDEKKVEKSSLVKNQNELKNELQNLKSIVESLQEHIKTLEQEIIHLQQVNPIIIEKMNDFNEKERVLMEEALYSNLARNELTTRKLINEIDLIEDERNFNQQIMLERELKLKDEINNLTVQLKFVETEKFKIEIELSSQFAKFQSEVSALYTVISELKKEKEELLDKMALFNSNDQLANQYLQSKIADLQNQLLISSALNKDDSSIHPDLTNSSTQMKAIKKRNQILIEQVNVLTNENIHLKTYVEVLKNKNNEHLQNPGIVIQKEDLTSQVFSTLEVKNQLLTNVSNFKDLNQKVNDLVNEKNDLINKISTIEAKSSKIASAISHGNLSNLELNITVQKNINESIQHSEKKVLLLKSKLSKVDFKEVNNDELSSEKSILKDHDIENLHQLLEESENVNAGLREAIVSLQEENLQLLWKILSLEMLIDIQKGEENKE